MDRDIALIVVIIIVALCGWAIWSSRALSSKYDDTRSTEDDADEGPNRRLALWPRRAAVPPGTSFEFADILRASVDADAPPPPAASVQVIHDRAETDAVIDFLVTRINQRGGRVVALSKDIAKTTKYSSENGDVVYELEFLVFNQQTTNSTLHPVEQVVKLRASVVRPNNSLRAKVRALTFATPRNAKPGPGDPVAEDPHGEKHARWASPLEILQQVELGPGAAVQT